ncbi:IAP-2 [Euproctis pseudoconspersa nucleopolyhedrovirus]|uniref:IAP-2 n=1 Tax=Euproctis pseudoconspersa nucleopolyhedrovirus TaxID=307467 RepID=C3TWX0_9ABAC|nr:IAP-2 [Euproctis pseudoconspersa nucleopolyhedrovirus]ACO53512.1 IAP-2 [Euproctis pseudoconspersa nucleopolyhedrovirus]
MTISIHLTILTCNGRLHAAIIIICLFVNPQLLFNINIIVRIFTNSFLFNKPKHAFRCNMHKKLKANLMMIDLPPPNCYKTFAGRMNSITSSKIYLTQNEKNNLVSQGIYYDANDAIYRCAYCAFVTDSYADGILKYHTYSACPKSTEILFNSQTTRKKSFESFKTSRKQFARCAQELAVNGFYYNGGFRDIRCSCCPMVIKKLNKNDCVKIVHKVYYPQCVFNVESDVATFEVNPTAPSAPPSWTDEHDDLWRCSVENANDNFVNQIAASDSANQDSCLCKICFERERQICFLPCGHVSACEKCAKRCSKCCMCRKLVKTKIKVYL